MVDVPVLGTGVLRRVGSSPTKGNKIQAGIFGIFFLRKIWTLD